MISVSADEPTDPEALSDGGLDAYLAERLFGWTLLRMRPRGPSYLWQRSERVERVRRLALCGRKPGHSRGIAPVPRYSSTGDGMLLVLDAMWHRVPNGWWCEMENGDSDPRGVPHRAGFKRCSEIDDREQLFPVESFVSLPRAVAEAAWWALHEPEWCSCKEHRWQLQQQILGGTS